MGPLAASLVVLAAALTVDVWVYRDARTRESHGDTPTVAFGSFRVETSTAWFLGCVILWVVFVPLYLTATGRNPFTR